MAKASQPTQTTSTQISPEAQQLFQMALPGLQQFAANTPQRYQGDTVTPFTPNQVAGQNSLVTGSQAGSNAVTAPLTNAINAAGALPGQLTNVSGLTGYESTPLQTSSNIFSDPGIWDPRSNPGVQSAITAATRPMYEQLTEQALPAISDTAISTGGLGGSREGIAQGLAIGRTSRAAGDVGARIAEDVYGQNLGAVNQRYATNLGAENQRYATDVSGEQARYATNTGLEQQRYQTNINATLAALGLTPQLTSQLPGAYTLPGGVQSAVGDQQQAQAQAQLQGRIQGFNYDQLAPFLQSREILSLLQGMPGATTTSTGNVPTPNLPLQALGGAASGAALGSMVMPGIGTGVGAAGGALLPFLFH